MVKMNFKTVSPKVFLRIPMNENWNQSLFCPSSYQNANGILGIPTFPLVLFFFRNAFN